MLAELFYLQIKCVMNGSTLYNGASLKTSGGDLKLFMQYIHSFLFLNFIFEISKGKLIVQISSISLLSIFLIPTMRCTRERHAHCAVFTMLCGLQSGVAVRM